MNLPLGQRVRIKATLSRTKTDSARIWVREELAVPKEGIVVGMRVRNDGTMDKDRGAPMSWSSSVPSYYRARSGFKSYLVAVDIATRHLVVMPNDIEVIR